MSMKNSSEPATFRRVEQCLNQLRYRVPQAYIYLHLFLTNIHSVASITKRFSYTYLATGASFRHLAFEFRMGNSTVGLSVKYVCTNRIAHIV
jgi:hypothetical protein